MKRLNLKLAFGVIVAFALCVMTSCNKINQPKYGSIQGIVTNYSTNEPLQGVNISLSPTGASAVTGSDGRYEFANLESGLYTVQGMKSGFETNTKTINVEEDQISSGDMMMRPVESGFRLNVEYLDFGTAFSTLSFKIINVSSMLPLSWEISESLNWLATTPTTGNLQAAQETTVTVTIDRTLITQNTTANITIRSADQTVILPVSVRVY